MFYWLMKFVVIGPLLRLFSRPKVYGLEYLPKEGPALLASNHLAMTDSFFLPLLSPRRVYFLAKSEYFTTPGLKGRFQKFFFSSAGQIPIDRAGANAAAAALEAAKTKIDENELMCLYPEGTRSPDGRLHKGKTGLARLAMQTGVPVIPVAMINTEKFNPPGTTLPRPCHVVVKFGKPLDFSRYEGMVGNRFIERAITDEIMYELMRLSGQEYVDVYAADIKAGKVADPNVGTDAA